MSFWKFLLYKTTSIFLKGFYLDNLKQTHSIIKTINSLTIIIIIIIILME